MVTQLFADLEGRMQGAVEAFRREVASIQAGRATPALLDRIMVDYYGTPTPVNQLANLNVPEPRLLLIQPWDKSTVPLIEKAIMKSDLGLTPASDGIVIRLPLPQPTEERRKELVRGLHRQTEESRVAVRNVRRDGLDQLKKLRKDGLSEDEEKTAEADVQKLTDKYINEIDQISAAKEKDILEV